MAIVSVIVPVFNVERYLGECLDSVLRQTLQDIEVICVNDGSTDGSAAIIARYAAVDSRVKVITQANAGLSAARNAGMDAASGKYVYFLDSDDWIVEDVLERCVEICERDHLDQLIFGCRINAEEESVDQKFLFKKEAFYKMPESMCGNVMPGSRFLIEAIKAGRYFPSVPLRFMRRDVVGNNGLRFPDGLLHEDEYFTPLILVVSKRVKAVVDRFYVRRLRAGSIMMSIGADALMRHLAHMMLIYLRLKNDASLLHLPHEARVAVGVSLKWLYRRVVRNLMHGHISVRDAWCYVHETPEFKELRKHDYLRMRLTISIMACKSIRRLRKLGSSLVKISHRSIGRIRGSKRA